MHARLLIICHLCSFLFVCFSVSRLVIYIFNDTTERTCYTCLVKLRDLLFTNEKAHRKQN